MKRVNFSIEKKQTEQLKKYYEETGVRMSEVVRRGIDLYFDKVKKGDKNASKNN